MGRIVFLMYLAACVMAVCSCSRRPSGRNEDRSAERAAIQQLASNCPVDQFRINGMRTDPQIGEFLFTHPKSECSITPPERASFVWFTFGILDTATIVNPRTDGVTFRVSRQERDGHRRIIWSKSLRPSTLAADRGPHSAVIPAQNGPGGRLIFETEPVSGTQNNWAYWSKLEFDRDLDATRVLAQNKLLDQFQIDGLRQAPGLGQILFAQPQSQFTLPVSARIQDVQFRFGILDGAVNATPPTDGVEFRVFMENAGSRKQIWSRTLKPADSPSDRGVQQASIPLSVPDGSRLIFETLPGKTWQNDWAYWSTLRIVLKDEATVDATQQPQ